MSSVLIRMASKPISARWAFNCFNWIPTPSEIAVASATIQTEEREKIRQYVFQKDAKRSIIGRLLIRKFISEAVHVPWGEIKIDRDENGKPFYSDSLIQFNVSHSGHWAVLAGEVGDILLGVDVMEMEFPRGRNNKEFFRLMRRHFSNEEWSSIEGCSSSERDQMRMFYRHWCLKESYVKATGTGITVNLQDISFVINSQALSKQFFAEDTELKLRGRLQRGWIFQEILLDDHHCAAVALFSKSPHINSCEKFSALTYDSFSGSGGQGDQSFCDNFFSKEV